MLRFFDVANALTLSGLAASLACALLAASGRAALAVVALIVAGLCDFFDGAIARRLERSEDQREFGGHLDSVVDACAFGLAPAVLLYAIGLRSIPELGLLLVLASCAVWRLAYFGTVGFEGDGDQRHYIGLPTTFVALVLPLVLLFGFAGAQVLRVAGVVSAIVLSLAMVSPIRIPKPGGKWYGIFLLLAIATIGVYAVFAEQFPAPPLS